MAEEIIIPLKVDSSQAEKEIKDTTKEIEKATKEQTLFTQATEKLKGAFKSLRGGVKTVVNTFKTLKGAIAATGIGLLVVALGSLVAFFTKTQRGADLLSEAMAGIGAAFDVVIDRISGVGESLVKFFTGDFKGAVDGLTQSFSGLGDEIISEANSAARLKKELNDLIDLEREFSVQKAKNNVIIRQAEAIAADESISLQQRVVSLKQALDLIEEQATQEEAVAEQRLKNIQEANSLGESTREDLQAEADAEIALINIRAEAADRRKALLGQFQSLNKQLIDERQIESEGEAIRLEQQSNQQIELTTQTIKTIGELQADGDKKLIDTRKKTEAALIKSKKETTKAEIALTKENTEAQLGAFGQLAGALSTLAGENKELAAAEAIIQTYLGANKAFGQGGVAGFVSAAAIIAAGLSNVQKILSTDVGSSGGGGGGSVAGISAGGVQGGDIAQTIPLGTNLGDVVSSIEEQGQQPVQAYVISQDVTNSQEAQTYINNQSTL